MTIDRKMPLSIGVLARSTKDKFQTSFFWIIDEAKDCNMDRFLLSTRLKIKILDFIKNSSYPPTLWFCAKVIQLIDYFNLFYLELHDFSNFFDQVGITRSYET